MSSSSLTDPFDELKSEVENNLKQLQNQLSDAEREIPYPSRETVDELLLSLQATREDADLLRSACRTLRRRAGGINTNNEEQNNNNNTNSISSMLAQRERFCEDTDAELDRIQLAIEDMQRKLIAKKDGRKSSIQNNPSKPSAVSVTENSSTNYNNNDNDDDQNDDRNLVISNNNEYMFGTTNAHQSSSAATSGTTAVIVDIRDWDREAALKKLKLRQKRRENEEEMTLDDLEPKHDGTWQGKAKYYYQEFQKWAIEFVDTLTPNQRIGWLVGMTFVVLLLIFALFTHHKK